MWNTGSVGRRVCWVGALVMGVGVVMAQPPADKPGVAPKQGAPADAKDKGAPRSAAEKLKASAEMYAAAKTYRDDGEVLTELDTKPQKLTSLKPFSTSFERDGRFKWEFKGSPMPGGPPKDTYTVWSKNLGTYQSYWSMNGQQQEFGSLDMAMAGPTGVSGGSATVVIPMLVPEMKWGIRTSDLSDAVEAGTEKVDGVDCAKIEGRQLGGAKVTVWLDGALAIRKVYIEQVVDPAKIPGDRKEGELEKFTARTTITLKPVFGEKIADERFAAPKMVK